MNREQRRNAIARALGEGSPAPYVKHQAAAAAILDAIEDISREVVAEAFKAVTPPAPEANFLRVMGPQPEPDREEASGRAERIAEMADDLIQSREESAPAAGPWQEGPPPNDGGEYLVFPKGGPTAMPAGMVRSDWPIVCHARVYPPKIEEEAK